MSAQDLGLMHFVVRERKRMYCQLHYLAADVLICMAREGDLARRCRLPSKEHLLEMFVCLGGEMSFLGAIYFSSLQPPLSDSPEQLCFLAQHEAQRKMHSMTHYHAQTLA